VGFEIIVHLVNGTTGMIAVVLFFKAALPFLAGWLLVQKNFAANFADFRGLPKKNSHESA
jgi:hypothetical protein